MQNALALPRLTDSARTLFPGLALAALVAMAAQFLSEHYGAPAMLMAILLGIALAFLSEEPRSAPGIAFASRGLLRIGVALLGVRISTGMVQELGPGLLGLIAGGVLATIGASILAAWALGRDRLFAFLSGGAVAICGASAAMAISSVLPKRDEGERDLIFTVVSVTMLSTLAMIAYPILADRLGFDARQTGVFLGGTIHDVAQVVGAGYSVSEETGDLSTLVKLIRVTMLAPIVLVAAVVMRSRTPEGATRPPLVPGFVLGFLALAALNSAGLLPGWFAEAASAVSRWALLTAIAAVGMKTSLKRLLDVGGPAIAMVAAQTAFIAVVLGVGVALIG
ncbi:putative sulfate exporter family transporter [Limimaricola variabilis]|uniref:YeiH family protein n=1 Tax=Limimaricola variabilis TaxID=1492771 RepID=UPI002AC8F723|nr:putative sulfate exporter family transporter [Limimaricola variabilis]WPY94189.1 putative sulfate exporter family transporter [Limimaricola variabilis]